MKALLSDLKERIKNPISTEDLSKLLFQLGHENDIHKNIIDIDITTNRVDCLSLLGILRDLKNFYKVDTEFQIHEESLKSLNLDFVNESIENCPTISFLKIEIDETQSNYKEYLENFFSNNTNCDILIIVSSLKHPLLEKIIAFLFNSFMSLQFSSIIIPQASAPGTKGNLFLY